MNLLLKMLSLRGLWNTGMEISSNLLVVWLWSHKECPMGISILESSESEVKVAQLCPTLCDPMDYIVHGTLQARILEWVAYPFSSRSSQLRNWTRVSCIASRFFTNWAMKGSLQNIDVIDRVWTSHSQCLGHLRHFNHYLDKYLQ